MFIFICSLLALENILLTLKYLIKYLNYSEMLSRYEDYVLGENEYFVLGDNRNHSADSREPSVGVLTREMLIGRAWVRIFPFDKIGRLDNK